MMVTSRDALPAAPNVGPAVAGELRTALSDALAWLMEVSPARSERRPRPGAWSAREVIGHLIDSASNNHSRRFPQSAPFRYAP